VLAVLLAILFVLLLLPALLAMSLEATVLNPGFLKAKLREADIYAAVHREVLPEQVKKQTALGGDLPFTREEAAALLQKTLPVAWLQEKTEEALDAVAPYLAGRQPTFAISVPLADRKQTFTSELLSLLERRYTALPDCTLAQLPRLANFQGFPECKPPGVPFSTAAETLGVRRILQEQVNLALPDSFAYSDKDLRRDNPDAASVAQQVGRARRGVLLLDVILIVLLLLVGVLGGRGLWGKLQWTGLTLLVGAALALAAAAGAASQARSLVETGVSFSGLPAGVDAKLSGLAKLVVDGLVGAVTRKALVLLVVGVVVAALAWLMPALRRRGRGQARG
ncbi:MAG: hypothetical protein HY686_02365, partial [Chloroflexi bacterium]|nr:hypothetical protein [Chloroflexota bacterium]